MKMVSLLIVCSYTLPTPFPSFWEPLGQTIRFWNQELYKSGSQQPEAWVSTGTSGSYWLPLPGTYKTRWRVVTSKQVNLMTSEDRNIFPKQCYRWQQEPVLVLELPGSASNEASETSRFFSPMYIYICFLLLSLEFWAAKHGFFCIFQAVWEGWSQNNPQALKSASIPIKKSTRRLKDLLVARRGRDSWAFPGFSFFLHGCVSFLFGYSPGFFAEILLTAQKQIRKKLCWGFKVSVIANWTVAVIPAVHGNLAPYLWILHGKE